MHTCLQNPLRQICPSGRSPAPTKGVQRESSVVLQHLLQEFPEASLQIHGSCPRFSQKPIQTPLRQVPLKNKIIRIVPVTHSDRVICTIKMSNFFALIKKKNVD